MSKKKRKKNRPPVSGDTLEFLTLDTGVLETLPEIPEGKITEAEVAESEPAETETAVADTKEAGLSKAEQAEAEPVATESADTEPVDAAPSETEISETEPEETEAAEPEPVEAGEVKAEDAETEEKKPVISTEDPTAGLEDEELYEEGEEQFQEAEDFMSLFGWSRKLRARLEEKMEETFEQTEERVFKKKKKKSSSGKKNKNSYETDEDEEYDEEAYDEEVYDEVTDDEATYDEVNDDEASYDESADDEVAYDEAIYDDDAYEEGIDEEYKEDADAEKPDTESLDPEPAGKMFSTDLLDEKFEEKFDERREMAAELGTDPGAGSNHEAETIPKDAVTAPKEPETRPNERDTAPKEPKEQAPTGDTLDFIGNIQEELDLYHQGTDSAREEDGIIPKAEKKGRSSKEQKRNKKNRKKGKEDRKTAEQKPRKEVSEGSKEAKKTPETAGSDMENTGSLQMIGDTQQMKILGLLDDEKGLTGKKNGDKKDTRNKQGKSKSGKEDQGSAGDNSKEQGSDKKKFIFLGGIAAAVICLILGLVISGHGRKAVAAQTDELSQVGSTMAELGSAGEAGLQAVADVYNAKLQAEQAAAEEAARIAAEEKAAAEAIIDMEVHFTSVEQDLKIKFVNKETQKLITGKVFEITLTDAKGKQVVLRDEDEDGIIYEKGIAGGDYKVAVSEMEGFLVAGLPDSVNVRDKIVYEKVQVAEEIKKESEVNVAQEDTAGKAAADEAVAEEKKAEAAGTVSADTVKYVESTKSEEKKPDSEEAEKYTKIEKDTINKPSYAMVDSIPVPAAAPVLPRLAAEESPAVYGMSQNSQYLPVVYEPSSSDNSTSENTSSESTTDSSTTDSDTSDSSTTSENTATQTTPEEVTATIKVSNVASLKVDETASLSAEAYEGDTKLSGGSFTYKSSNTDALTVDSDGKLTAKVTASEVVITITYENKENSSKTYSGSKEIKIAVNEKDKATLTAVKVDPTETNVKAGDSTTLKATAEFNDGSTVTDGSKFTWSSEDESLATVNGEGKVTGVKYGTVRILVKYKDSSGNETSSACTVKVEQDPAEDTTTLLKDKNGNQVYVVNDDGQFVEAKYADYFTEDEFYILKPVETEVKYTGWQTIDGNTYYFDENGNKVTGEQVIQGVTYKFDSNGALIVEKGAILGIDVSKWNGTINWTSVKNSGVKFVIIRCGYRGSATGVLVEDSAFKKNVQGAQAVGLKVGVYFYTQAVNEVEAVEEASMALELLQGISLSYPVFIDTEYTTSRTGRADKIDKATRTAICRAFCETIRSGGYVPGIYASKDWYINNLDYGSLSGYCIWLAQYASATTFTQHYDIWQYSEKGSVDGIKGTVDMNYSYMGY